MKSESKKALVLGICALLLLSCNLPLNSLIEKVIGSESSGDGSSGDDSTSTEESSGGGLFSNDDNSSNTEKNLKEKDLQGELQIISQSFWATNDEEQVTLAVLARNTDTELTIFHPDLQFQILDSSGQEINFQQGSSIRLEEGKHLFEDVILYPGQEFLYCEVLFLENNLANDVAILNVTPPSDLKGVDLGVTSNPLTAVKSTFSDQSSPSWFQLLSEVLVNNNSQRLTFFPTITTAGLDSNGNLVTCGKEWATPGFLRPDGEAASTFIMTGKSVPARVQSYITQRPVDYFMEDTTWKIKDSNQLKISETSFIHYQMDLIPIFNLSNENDLHGTVDYIIQYSAYDSEGNVVGAESTRMMGLFAEGTSYGPYRMLQSFVRTGKQIAKVDVDVLTLDNYDEDYIVPINPLEYSAGVYNPDTQAIDAEVTNLMDKTLGWQAFAACLDNNNDLVGFGWASGFIDPKTTTPTSFFVFESGGPGCSSATRIEINTEYPPQDY